MAINIRRREFITLLGGAAATWPLAARAQQPAMPVVGFLSGRSAGDTTANDLAAFRQGLKETGYIEGQNVAIEYRWAENRPDQLPALAADLVRRPVAVIAAAGGTFSALAAKTATAAIPIVFTSGGDDPVAMGLVASLNRPGGNITGISTMNLDLGSKWIGLLHELLPAAKRFAVLVNIENADSARSIITQTQEAALALGTQTEILFASNEREIDAALVDLGARAQALIMHPDVLFTQNLEKLAALAIREKLAALYSTRNFPQAGGLLSYGSSFRETQRQAGVYAGRILKGEKPGDLPVQRATKFDFVINLKTAKTIGIDIPATLLVRVDEVIE